ncbi:MAG TPA: hypothetical protein VI078_01635 [bacterium]
MDDRAFARLRWAAYGLVFCLYALHFAACAQSALPEFARMFDESDMQANLKWAESIREQGLLNPRPFHPYTA